MASNASVASELLINAAKFFRIIANSDANVRDKMLLNAETYEDVAKRLVDDPTGDSELLRETSTNDNAKKPLSL